MKACLIEFDMTIEELEREYYEDLNGKITAVSLFNAGLDIAFECDDWRKNGRVEVTIRCHDLAYSTVRPSASGLLRLVDDHPVLWEYNTEHLQVYFLSRPQNAFELSGRLHEAVAQLFDRFQPCSRFLYASAETLAVGNGLLARGPRPVMEALMGIAQKYVLCSMIPTHKPAGGYKLLEFDDCYAVCRWVELLDSR
jgi:hypothetical protein